MVTDTILVTGSQGLIGRSLVPRLIGAGNRVRRFDLKPYPGEKSEEVVNQANLVDAVEGCRGIVHLAAVSRVVWGEADPQRCRRVNVGGTSNVIAAAVRSPARPWIVLASSREVYGNAVECPVCEDMPLRPLNAYASSKVAAEELVVKARESELRTAVIRLSSVYGDEHDHPDRVVPAFLARALAGSALRVDGLHNMLDLTYVGDVVEGLIRLIGLIERVSEPIPPVHLVSGSPTTLGELAEMVIRLTGSGSLIEPARSRPYDTVRFWGDPRRAQGLLGWQATTGLEDGLSTLLEKFLRLNGSQPGTSPLIRRAGAMSC